MRLGRKPPQPKRFERIVAGDAAGGARPGALVELALRIRDHAATLGLQPVAFRASRARYSGTRTLELRDGRGRRWLVRVASHPLPGHTGHEEPHLDLVSLDGRSGLDETCAYLTRISRGEIEWRQPHRRPCPRARR